MCVRRVKGSRRQIYTRKTLSLGCQSHLAIFVLPKIYYNCIQHTDGSHVLSAVSLNPIGHQQTHRDTFIFNSSSYLLANSWSNNQPFYSTGYWMNEWMGFGRFIDWRVWMFGGRGPGQNVSITPINSSKSKGKQSGHILFLLTSHCHRLFHIRVHYFDVDEHVSIYK